MDIAKIRKIMVLGAGVMGHGIALVAAQSGFDVLLVDVREDILQKAMDQIKKFLEGGLKRGKITREKIDMTVSHIFPSTNMRNEAKEADFLIEAIIESKEVKSGIFADLDAACKTETIFASNTSQLSITELGQASQRPGDTSG